MCDFLGYFRDEVTGDIVLDRYLAQMSKLPNYVIVQWSVVGLNQTLLDTSAAMGVEILASASQIRVLNAFQWALNEILPSVHPCIELSALFGEVDHDEVLGRKVSHSGRAYRAWRFAVNDNITGMNQLIEVKKDDN